MKTIFSPFRRNIFGEDVCFLTGEPAILQKTVFPEWMIRQFNLEDKPLKMLDEHIVNYGDITLPVSAAATSALQNLEEEVQEAFTGGYPTVVQLPELRLFQWIAKQVYGMIHWETRAGIKQQRAQGEDFYFSQSIAHKFGNLHLMLQSLSLNMEFEGVLPWTIKIFPVNNAPDTFSYRDEINTLMFSLRMNDFGIIACLQDNGESNLYHKDILARVENNPLHPIQFEEVCARFFYSAYLFNRLPEYTVLPTTDTVFVEAMPLRISGRPLYDIWQTKTYGQVLENFWKTWGYSLFEIIRDPENPMTFLTRPDGSFISAEDVVVPA